MFIHGLLLLVLTASLGSYSSAQVQAPSDDFTYDIDYTPQNPLDSFDGLGLIETLNAAVAAGLDLELANMSAAFSVLAPTDVAWARMYTELALDRQQLATDKQLMQSIVSLHVLPGPFIAADVPSAPTRLPTRVVSAEDPGALVMYTSSANSSQVMASSVGALAKFIVPNVRTGQSYVHIMDSVLLPFHSSVSQAAQYNGAGLFADAIAAASQSAIVSATFTGTVFVPTDDAFRAGLASLGFSSIEGAVTAGALRDILRYHVVPSSREAMVLSSTLKDGQILDSLLGGKLRLYKSESGESVGGVGTKGQIVKADNDVIAGRAVVHVIDTLLLPYYASPWAALQQAAGLDVPGSPSFGINVSMAQMAVSRGNMTDALNVTMPLTVFVPNDAAFIAGLARLRIRLSNAARDGPLNRGLLRGMHVVGRGMDLQALRAVGDSGITMADGVRVTVTNNASGLFLIAPHNGTSVKIIQADIPAAGSSSYVHVVDGLLIPGQDPFAPAPPPPLFGASGACRHGFTLLLLVLAACLMLRL